MVDVLDPVPHDARITVPKISSSTKHSGVNTLRVSPRLQCFRVFPKLLVFSWNVINRINKEPSGHPDSTRLCTTSVGKLICCPVVKIDVTDVIQNQIKSD